MNIVIIGYRASGKSTLALAVSERLAMPLCDVDRGIERHFDSTLTEAWQRDPVLYRDVEAGVVKEMCSRDGHVISFGAGSILREESQINACRNSLVAYLELSAEQLLARIEADTKSADTRPSLTERTGLDEILHVLPERAIVYDRCANITLDAAEPPDVLTDHVVAAFTGKKGKY